MRSGGKRDVGSGTRPVQTKLYMSDGYPGSNYLDHIAIFTSALVTTLVRLVNFVFGSLGEFNRSVH